jgi:hypothetical protein
MIEHDRLFKAVIRTFLAEFIEMFFSGIAAEIDAGSFEFLDKQVFTDVLAGERHEADLVVKARWRGRSSFFLLHIEPQSGWQALFPRRMFIYFSRLYETYGVEVYPIAVLTYDAPLVEAPSEHVVGFSDGRVLAFHYHTVQLNRLNWREMGMHFTQVGHPTPPPVVVQRGRLRRFS